MSDDRLKIRCPCGQTLAVKKSDGGKAVACPSCSTKLRVPGAAPTQATAFASSTPSPTFDPAPADNDLFSGLDLGSLPSNQPMANPYRPPVSQRSSATPNPYAPTSGASNLGTAGNASSGDVATRNEFLSHETSLKSIGLLYILSAIFMFVCGFFALLIGAGTLLQGKLDAVIVLAFGFVYIGIGVLQIFVARGIRRLENWARIAVGVISIPGLLGIPLGTLISVYFLYLCFSKKGEFVCSPHYRQVVANTPHIQYKTSIVVWIFVGLLVFVLGLGLLAGLIAAFVA